MHKMRIYKIVNLLKINTLILFILIINSYIASAQLFDAGQNPPGLKWRQINTQHFQLLYPALLELEAQRMANSLDYIIGRVSRSINKDPKRITVILQNQTVESNGFVQLAPRHSEFYATPSQEFDSQDWLNSLAVHELRHVVQIDKLTGSIQAPGFESLAFAFFGVSLPAWFFEGDAVLSETLLTEAGRGRQPSFNLYLRANLLSNRHYSYGKNYLGSLKDLTSGYYPLGYFMVTKLRRDYGDFILDTLLRQMANHPFRLYNLSKTSQKLTGLTTEMWYKATTNELTQLWTEQLNSMKHAEYSPLNKRNTNYAEDYLLPQRSYDGSLIALKHSKAHTSLLVQIDENGKEQTLLAIGIQQEPNMHVMKDKVVWDELRVDERYSKRTYNVICVFDLKTHKYKQITHKTRLFSPALSPNGEKIVAIEVDFSNKMTLVELDAKTGKILKQYANSDFSILQSPKYHASGSKIVYLKVRQQGTAIEELDLTTQAIQQKLAPEVSFIARPTYAGDSILFKAHYNGIDNIYQLSGKGISQLSTAKFGAYYPYFDEKNKKVLFSNFGPQGHDIAEFGLDTVQTQAISTIKNTFVEYAAPLKSQDGAPIDFKQVPQNVFKSNRYSQVKNAFNFHSFVPILANNEFTDELNLGIKAVSNNLMNTVDFYAGYVYNQGLRKSEYQAGITYKALYPILKLDFKDRARRTVYNDAPITWREQMSELSINIPFAFNHLDKHGTAGLEIATSYTARNQISGVPQGLMLPSSLAFPMQYSMYINQNTRRSTRDLAPRWGQNFLIAYEHLPFDKQLKGKLLSTQSLFFTPGLWRNHSFSASFNTQTIRGTAYDYALNIPTISGYNNLINTEFLQNTLLLDYRFPIAYPDWEIGSLAYIKRIRASLFADYENIAANKAFRPRSYGFELRADVNLLRFYLPNFNVGGKMIFTNEKSVKKPIFEFGINYSY